MPTTPPGTDSGPILFFDGVCNLCNGAVKFIIRHDGAGKVRFAALQSEAGQQAQQAVYAQLGKVPDSLILYDQGHYYVQSAAALRVAGFLDGGWRLLKALLIFPSFVRDAVYRTIAAKRYRWFGQRDACMIPTPDLKRRFLD